MDSDLAIYLSSEMISAAAMIAAPILGIAMIVGLLVSVFQVVTQIQEMTLTFIPKIIAVAIVLLLAGGWMLTLVINYATDLYKSIPQLV